MSAATDLTKRALVGLAVELPSLAAAALQLGRTGLVEGAGELHSALAEEQAKNQPTTGQRVAKFLRAVLYAGGGAVLGSSLSRPLLRGPLGQVTSKFGPEIRLGPIGMSSDRLANLLAGTAGGLAGGALGRRLHKVVHPDESRNER